MLGITVTLQYVKSINRHLLPHTDPFNAETAPWHEQRLGALPQFVGRRFGDGRHHSSLNTHFPPGLMASR